MLDAILAELAAGSEQQREIEAKAIFRLLNYCPREAASLPAKPPMPC